MTPFLIAAIGGLFTEKAGILNIALEGLILIGAFASIVVTYFTGSLLLGICGGVTASLLISLLFAEISLHLKTNIFISGLAINLLAIGITTFFSTFLFDTKGVVRIPIETDVSVLKLFQTLGEVPFFGKLIFNHSVFVYVSIGTVLVAAWLINRTAFGLRLRATGLNPDVLTVKGENPLFYKLIAILISGAACGLAGANLALRLGAYVPNISGGRGWIALVIIFLGRKKPVGVLIAGVLFGFAEAFTHLAQRFEAVPNTLLLSFPYLATLTALVFFSLFTYRTGK